MALVKHLPGYLGRRGQLPLIDGVKPRMGFARSLGRKVLVCCLGLLECFPWEWSFLLSTSDVP